MAKIVIIGNSAAGFSCLETLLREAPGNEITVISREEYPAYRKDLLLDYLAGNINGKDIFLCSEDFYKRKNVRFLKNSQADRIDTKKQLVILKNKVKLNYDYLIIASGEESNIPDIPGRNKDGVVGVSSLTDIERIKERLMVADTVCIIGKLKYSSRLAEVIVSQGKEVKIITEEDNAPDIGIDKTEIINRVFPRELIGDGQLQALKLSNGKVIGTELTLFYGNYAASSDFLKDAPVETEEGYVLTDGTMRTNIDNVFSCGRVAKSRGLPEKEKLWKDNVDEGGLAAEGLIRLAEKDQ